ncbi:MAG TPA: DUF5723 family protein [Chitinophagales bacterium]|nr:DUF5723 family protein [Chitinophagales bacterium]
MHFVFLMKAQQNLGIWNGNYAGIQGAGLNPSAIADSKLKWDVNVLSGDVVYDNTFLFIPRDSLKFFGIKNIIDDITHQTQFITEFSHADPNQKFNVTLSTEFVGPSVMFPVGKKSEIGFTTAARFYANINDITGHFGQNAFAYLLEQDLYKTTFLDNTAKLNAMGWLEYGGTYSTVLYSKGRHELKGGITIKYLQGIAAAYFNHANVTYNIVDTLNLLFFNSSIDYGRTDYNSLQDANGLGDLINGHGAAGNIGFTYVHLRDSSQFSYEMDCKNLADPDKSNYLYRIGISLLDAGSIKFHKNTAVYHLQTDSADFVNWHHAEFTSNIQFDRSLSAVFYHGDSSQSFVADHFSMDLPVALSLQADLNVYKHFFLNVTIVKGFPHGSKPGVIRPDVYSFTPRIETKWLEISLPLSLLYYHHLQQRIGLSVRAGYFFIGGDAPGSLLKLNDMEGADFYAGFHIFMPQKKLKDADHDLVSDEHDECPIEKGTCLTHGCPDKDGDGVVDKFDACPDLAGPAYLQGCPDRDHDSIPDKDDECPDLKGPKALHGCPDSDGDGIIDPNDSCPTQKGLAQFYGCPDTDGDGIPDQKDECPTQKGSVELHGCPDRDGDGIADNKDRCPDEAGPASNGGCPIPKPEEIKKINMDAKAIQYQTGSAKIQKKSYAVLDDIVAFMKQYPQTKWTIEGHTDDVGKDAYNLDLSERRAASVMNYFISKGISADRLASAGYGESRPIADNKMAAGRAQNRRTEIHLIEQQ